MEALKHSGTASASSSLTDSEVVSKVLSGEKQLYELLMRRHNQKLYRVIRSYLRNEKETEDAMQDTYLKAFEKLHQFRHHAQFSTWLIRIGINMALSKIRKDKLLLSAQTDLIDYSLPSASANTPTDPENIMMHEEAKRLLEKAIDAIPAKYRIVYTLREIEEMSVQEVMTCLELTESNVKVRLHRAKALLKENLYQAAKSRKVFAFGASRCDNIVLTVMAALSSGGKV